VKKIESGITRDLLNIFRRFFLRKAASHSASFELVRAQSLAIKRAQRPFEPEIGASARDQYLDEGIFLRTAVFFSA